MTPVSSWSLQVYLFRFSSTSVVIAQFDQFQGICRELQGGKILQLDFENWQRFGEKEESRGLLWIEKHNVKMFLGQEENGFA